MFGGIRNNHKPVIGVEVGQYKVRLAQWDAASSTPRILALATEPLPGHLVMDTEAYHQAVAEAVMRAYTRGGFLGKRIVSCLPAKMVQVKSLRVPPMPEDEMRQAIAWEAAERFEHFAGQRLSVRHLRAGTVRQGEDTKEEVIAMAVPEAHTELHAHALADQGFVLKGIDISMSAVHRLLRWHGRDEAEPIAVLMLSQSGAQVMVVRNGNVRFYRWLEIGLNHMDEQVAQRLGITAEAASRIRRGEDNIDTGESRQFGHALRQPLNELAHEVSLCLRYDSVTFRQPRPEVALQIGEGGDLPGLSDALEEGAGLKTSVMDPFEGVDTTGFEARVSTPACRASWALSMGSALKSLRAGTHRRAA